MELNERGNQVKRYCILHYDRYSLHFKLCTFSRDWVQFDTGQDSGNFGVWINKSTLQILTFKNGHVGLVRCPDAKHFNAEIQSMIDLYHPQPHIFTVTGEDGMLIKYKDNGRENYFIK